MLTDSCSNSSGLVPPRAEWLCIYLYSGWFWSPLDPMSHLYGPKTQLKHFMELFSVKFLWTLCCFHVATAHQGCGFIILCWRCILHEEMPTFGGCWRYELIWNSIRGMYRLERATQSTGTSMGTHQGTGATLLDNISALRSAGLQQTEAVVWLVLQLVVQIV